MSLQTPNEFFAQPQFRRVGTVTLALVALNVAVFIFQNVVDELNLFPIYPDFALSLDGLKHGRLWQLASFQFLHVRLIDGGVFHLLANLFLIYVFGKPVERLLGPARFLGLYILSGTIGGLLQMAADCLAPGQFGNAVVGASAGACGLLAAHATLFSRQKVHFFFLPVAVRNDILLALVMLVALAGLFLPMGRAAHCAHLGGMFTGYLLTRGWLRRQAVLPTLVKSPLKSASSQSYN